MLQTFQVQTTFEKKYIPIDATRIYNIDLVQLVYTPQASLRVFDLISKFWACYVYVRV